MDATQVAQRLLRNYIAIFDRRAYCQIFDYDGVGGVIVLDRDRTRRVLLFERKEHYITSTLESVEVDPSPRHPLNELRPLDCEGSFKVFFPDGVTSILIQDDE